ncbi:MAG: undecaprenyldiphospho-muramoylpentapeptide beta-N-acetylglucosaminyltransferase [Candidatus Omnitrophota bacterium]|nr:undecaprenyldiphospho-muramoylpentapeptide beta-N-acetylglucosaminyltransferase [Candidatus Omnitrophota bacterium]
MKVLVAAGSSGGHIFPAVGFLDGLRNKYKGIELLLVLPKRVRTSHLVYDLHYKVRYISVSPISFRLDFKNFIAILRFFKGWFESLFLLFEFKPDIVVGFGSLDSVPVLLSAWLLRIRTLIHEQNLIPGRANRLLAKFADKVAVSFAETKDYLKINQEKVVFTGNPLRQELKKIDRPAALHFFGFDDLKFTILVMGGSQGSQRINSCFFKAISTVPDKSRLQVIHIAGERDRAALERSYKEIALNARIFAFLKQMQYAYSICDLVVSRAGATAISELIFFRVPAIIIPYPFAYKHQFGNAEILEKMGTAVVIKDDQLDAARLRQALDGLMHNPERLALMRSYYSGALEANANDLLTQEALFLAR